MSLFSDIFELCDWKHKIEGHALTQDKVKHRWHSTYGERAALKWIGDNPGETATIVRTLYYFREGVSEVLVVTEVKKGKESQ